ncbi:3-beta hydroxysteroid dehydrogenase isomerase family [Moniliophthora roreri]|uniref:Putative NAD-P-binding protein n=1 Tax=Moniliophthora roreri TaxID=221103 RepID=A0A0W0FJM8_MONRR|nr:3-beta hydroxysteroid dehydrogenase isomerase family [Moniliophthora roreri]
MGGVFYGFAFLGLFALLYAYVRMNDKAIQATPDRARKFSPTRCTEQNVLSTAAELQSKAPISIEDQIPEKTGRRYTVTGGAGFLGGWIVIQLLTRGEDPKNIRVLDIRYPTRRDLKDGIGKDVDYRKVDVSDADAVQKAFEAPWPSGSTTPITVFHTAANIRFFERHPSLLPNSTRVNVVGTQNVLNAARSVGVSTFISTSSGSVGVRASHFLLWPWQKEPKHFVQLLNDDDTVIPTRHQDFFSNYSYSKYFGEKLVRGADRSPSGDGIMRTGCIRPGNGVYGPGGDMLCGAYLVRKTNPTWISNIIQNDIYVENCAVAHLCYERRLIDLEAGSKNPDIGGQAFNVTDPGPPPTYGDLYVTMKTLTDGETTFPEVSATGMLLFAYLIEIYYLTRNWLLTTPIWPAIKYVVPPVNGDLVNLQPSMWNLTMVHIIFDDSRARLPPEKGGLGYKGAWTTLEGLQKLVEEHKKGINRSEQRSDIAGVSFRFGMVRAQRGVAKVGEQVKKEIGVDPVTALGSQ